MLENDYSDSFEDNGSNSNQIIKTDFKNLEFLQIQSEQSQI